MGWRVPHGYMEYRVTARGCREPKGDRVGTRLPRGLVRPEALEQALRTFGVWKTVLDIGSAPDREGRGLGTAGIAGHGIGVVRSHVFPRGGWELILNQ